MGIFSYFKEKKMKELRRYPRRETRDLVVIELPEEELHNLVDISEGGMKFCCPYRPYPGKIFTCRINLAERRSEITVLVKVIWSKIVREKDYHVGTCFLSIKDEARNLIREFVTGNPAPSD